MILSRNVRIVMLQFNFTNPDAIPPSVKRLGKESNEEHTERKGRSTGVMVITPTENCSLVEFLGQFEETGYEMVDALYKERIDAKDPRGKRTYHMVRFLFARHEFAELSDEFKEVRDAVRAYFQTICEKAMWRVRAFDNPFYANGEEVSSHRALSINLEARQPLFQPDGTPIKVWQKDPDGRRMGEAPRPLKADHRLLIVGSSVSLV